MPIAQLFTSAEIRPWYRPERYTRQVVSIALFFIGIKEAGGHLPTTGEAWFFLLCYLAVQVWGAQQTESGANKVAPKL